MGPPQQITRHGRETSRGGGGHRRVVASAPAPTATLIYGPGQEGGGHGHGAGRLREECEPTAPTQRWDLQLGPPQPPGVSSTGEGGRRFLHAWGPMPGVPASWRRLRPAALHVPKQHSKKASAPGLGTRWAAKPPAAEVCLLCVFPHAPAPGTVLAHQHHVGHRARVETRVCPVKTRVPG